MSKIKIRDQLKYAVTQIEATLLKALWIFPVKKDTILFLSYDGKQYSDSPRCLSEEIHQRFPEKEIVWAINNGEKLVPPDAGCIVDRNSIFFLFTICTAGTIISNNAISSYIPIRKTQIFLNTWHGGSPTKTVGFREQSPNSYYKYHFLIQDKKTTAIISSSDFFTKEVIEDSFGFQNTEVLKFGLPRNDILLSKHDNVTKQVYNFFSIKHDKNIGIVLYAPTFRGSANDSYFLDKEDMLSVTRCVSILEKKFNKKFIFLFRAHHAMKSGSMPGSISATEYPNMQDLLCAADVLITDYSSCMHDFCLTKKPVFLYIPDYDTYMESRGFYWDIPTMPFPYAKNQLDFEKIICTFDSKNYIKRVEDYLCRLGNYEDGKSTCRTIDWLEEMWGRQAHTLKDYDN